MRGETGKNMRNVLQHPNHQKINIFRISHHFFLHPLSFSPGFSLHSRIWISVRYKPGGADPQASQRKGDLIPAVNISFAETIFTLSGFTAMKQNEKRDRKSTHSKWYMHSKQHSLWISISISAHLYTHVYKCVLI